MSLEPSSSFDEATASRDSVDHSSEYHDHAVNTTQLNTESRCYKYDGEVFTKYKDWDLTQTENHASNDNANDGDLRENPTSNDQLKEDIKEEVVEKIEEEIKAEGVEKIEEEIKEEIKEKVEEEIKGEIEEDIKEEIEEKVEEAIKGEVEEEIEEEIEEGIEENVEEAIREDVEEEIENENNPLEGDTPDSWGLSMSIKRAILASHGEHVHTVHNFTREFHGGFNNAVHIILLVENKRNALITLLNEIKNYQGILIYVQDDIQANFIALYLTELDYPSVSIQSNHEISKQNKALEDFNRKRVKILVATDVALEEKDLSDIKVIINYDLPNNGAEFMDRVTCIYDYVIAVKVFSFFDPKRDSKITFGLLNFLRDYEQNIPAFLPHFCVDDDYQQVDDTNDEDEKQVANPN